MTLIARILTLTKQLYPTGRAWKMPFGGSFEKLHKALVKSEVSAYEDARSVLDSILPDNDRFTAEDAADWERRLGMITNEGVGLENRKLAIIRKLNHPGTIPARQSALYLQNQLRSVGFDVYVHERVIPGGVTLGAFRLGQKNLSGTFAGGEILANRIDPQEDVAFDPPGEFQYVFYIANETLDGFVDIPFNRRDEFRQLILKVKPAHSIGVLMVNYVSWLTAGNAFNISGTGIPAIAALSGDMIAFIDAGNRSLRAYSFDGTDWSQVGNALSLPGIGTPAIAALSGDMIAFIDSINAEIRTYSFDGTDWSQVGNALSLPPIGTPALSALSPVRIAFADSTNDTLTTFDFDGTDWAESSTGLVLTGSSVFAITTLSATRIVAIDSINELLTAYDLDETGWSQTGTSLSIPGIGGPALATIGSNTVVFIAGPLDALIIYEFSGKSFFRKGVPFTINGIGVPALAALSEYLIAFIDATNEDLMAIEKA